MNFKYGESAAASPMQDYAVSKAAVIVILAHVLCSALQGIAYTEGRAGQGRAGQAGQGKAEVASQYGPGEDYKKEVAR